MATYTGSCHCQAVKYEVETDLAKVIECNCSNCGRRGLMLNFVPEDKFRLLQGEDSLKPYLFNKHVINHMICTDCGVESFAKGKTPDGGTMAAINVRCLEGVKFEDIETTFVNGRDR